MTASPSSSNRLLSRVRRAALGAVLLMGSLLLPSANAATGAKNFDHISTGFPLTGQHGTVRCEECHVNGVFKGTPTACSACHLQGGAIKAVYFDAAHFPTTLVNGAPATFSPLGNMQMATMVSCANCHTTATFYGAHFPHSDVAPGTCASCHTTPQQYRGAQGKTANHLQTVASCDACHTTAAFTSAYVSYPKGHIPTAEPCSVCHAPDKFVPAIGYPTAMVHTGITTGCTLCHAAAASPTTFTIIGTIQTPLGPVKVTDTGLNKVVTPKPEGSGHIPTARSCELCHAAGFAGSPQSFKGGVMNHDGITAGCAACHADGKSFTGVSNLVTMSTKGTHIPLAAGQDCSTCHTSVKAFGPGTAMNHAGITTSCNSCHEATGVAYYNLPNLAVRPTSVDAVHPAVGDGDCSSCHALAFTAGAFNIPTVLPAAGHGPSLAHLPNPAGKSCATCHTTVSAGATAAATAIGYSQYVMGATGHAGITNSCQSCHEGGSSFLNIGFTSTLVVRPYTPAVGVTPLDSNHPLKTAPNGADCVNCHSNSGFGTGGFTNVATKPQNHIATTGVACSTCHSSGLLNAVALPMPHSGAVSGTCASCHSGQTFAGSVFTPSPSGPGGTFDTSTGVNFVATQITTKISAGISTNNGHVALPSGDDCSTCHLSTSAFSGTAMVHTNITTGCNSCHESTDAFFGVANLAIRPTSIDNIHPASGDGDCSTCHTVAFGAGAFNIPTVLPSTSHGATATHLPNPAGKSCVTCHTTESAGLSATAAFAAYGQYMMGPSGHGGISNNCQSCHERDLSPFLNINQSNAAPLVIMVRPNGSSSVGITPIDAAHPPISATNPSGVDCVNCHASSGFVAGGFNNVTAKPPGHIAITGVACSTCHTGSSYTSVVLPMPHTGAVTGTCASCHNNTTPYTGSTFTPNTGVGASGGSFGTQTGSNFVAKQIVSSPAIGATGGHIPLPGADDCGTCHLSTAGFGSTAMVHTNITTGCNSCHETSNVWYGVSNLAVRPTAVDSIHPATADGDCSSCHTVAFGAGAFNIPTVLPSTSHGATATHLPNPAGKSCVTCHTTESAGLSATAAFAAYGQYVMGPSGHGGISNNCQSCHERDLSPFLNINQSNAAPLVIVVRPNGSGSVGITPLDAAHPPISATNPSGVDCVTCHASSGFVVGGFNNVSSKPANHINVSAAASCSSCHTVNFTSVVEPMPHSSVVGTCDTCHSGQTFAGSVFSASSGLGSSGGTFGTTSGTNFVATQITSKISAGFGAGGHVGLPSGDTCNVCHQSSATQSYTSFAGGAMVHTGITTGCNSCHEAGLSFAGVTNPALAVRPTAFDLFHPVAADGDCSSCHAIAFTSGAFNIPTKLPAVGHAAGIAHMPNPAGTACATCHTGLSAGISANQAYTDYTNYVMGPSGHTGISSACQTCHERGSVFLNMTQTGTLMVRPNGTAIGITIADAAHPAATAPNGVDCVNCHSGTGYVAGGFSSAVTKPAGHINVSSAATCSSCHTAGTTSVVLPMPHTNVVGTCASCHYTTTFFAGSTFTPNVGTSGGTFGAQTSGLNFQPRQIVPSPAVGAAGGHIPVPSGDDCSVCHTSTAAFGPGTAMVHTGITSGCATCHYAGAKWYGESYTASPLVTTGNKTLSPLHVPINTSAHPACEECHSTTVFTSFGTATRVNHTSGAFMTYANGGNTNNKSSSATSTPKCITCHAPSRTTWYGVSLSTETMGSHENSASGDDCIMCHNTGSFGGAAAAAARARRPIMRAAGPAVRPRPLAVPGIVGAAVATTPGVAAPFTHVGVVPGACASCHTMGGSATPKPANHLPTALSCDTCHRTSAWLPALFAHNGVAAGTCASCHAGNWATSKPANHMLSSRTCDSCHKGTTSWLPPAYTHMDMIYSPHAPSVRCIDCHSTNTEQVVWKYPNLKPGCAGCHGSQFAAPKVRRSKGPVVAPRSGP